MRLEVVTVPRPGRGDHHLVSGGATDAIGRDERPGHMSRRSQ